MRTAPDLSQGYGLLSVLDISAIAVYLIAMASITYFVNRRVGASDSEHFFLGGRGLPWWAIGFSLFASNLGTDHLVGLAGSGAATGLAVGNYEWSATYTLLILGWVFCPHYLGFHIYTVPEYLEKRFSGSLRNFFTWLSIATCIFTKISVTIFAGGVVLREVLHWNMWISSIVLLGLTALYTAFGGLAAVVYTEVIQSLILIFGSVALLYFGMEAVGGWDGLRQKLPDDHFKLLRPLNDPDFPWLGVLVGMPINSIWYWCTDQVMVQRVLGAKDLSHSQGACVFAGWMKISPMYIMVLPGLVAAALYPKEIAEDSNRAYALLVTRLLPEGWQGAMIAVMLSSFMAALASCFNSCSTLFTMDVYAKWYPDHTEQDLVRMGRIFTVTLAALSLAWLPIVDNADDQLFMYIQGMQVIWCSPIATVFLASVWMDDLTSSTAWITLIAGLSLGTIFWLLQETFLATYTPVWILKLNILHFAIISFVFCWIVLGLAHFCFSSAETQSLLSKEDFRRRILQQKYAGFITNGLAVALVLTVAALTFWHS